MTPPENRMPRRAYMSKWEPAEWAIYSAVQIVECEGADPLLTEAIILLDKAKDKMSEFYDRKKPKPGGDE